MAEEVRFFGRIALFAVLIGTVYWFVSYEAAGTVMLLGFGLATGVAFVLLRRGERAAGLPASAGGEGSAGAPDSRRPDGPFGDESSPVPTRSAAPLTVGVGVALIALGAAFGPWFALAGLLPLLIGAADWLGAANRELDRQRPRAGEPGAGEPGGATGVLHSAPHGDDREE
jgi:hypothetical protein